MEGREITDIKRSDGDTPQETLPATDVVIIGAGFGGLYAHQRLRQLGLTLQGFEAAPGVGGTWYWNAYPGARCDVESLDYCYSFSDELLEEWEWSERFATQPEILRYANHVADRFDLRHDIAFDTRITSCTFDDATNRWTLETDTGKCISARFVIAATGCLSAPILPDIDGIESFAGTIVQTSAWPHDGVELAGKRVGIIGTGSSGIQTIPVIAQSAAHLTVFQRTPNFSLPARNGPVSPEKLARVKADYPAYARSNKLTPAAYQVSVPSDLPEIWSPGRSALDASDEERSAIWDTLWNAGGTGFTYSYTDLTTNADSNQLVAEYVHGKIRDIVDDPETAEKLCPKTNPFGTKRLCLDSDYFATFNRPNVSLVDLRATPITRITADGVEVGETVHSLDVLIFATGFDAMTGPLLRMNVKGVGGTSLNEEWADGPHNYLGLMVAGFPNLFSVTGPGSPSVLTNMIPSVEQHIDWIADCLEHLVAHGLERIEATPTAQEEWGEEVRRAASHSLFLKADSWYMGANVPGKPRVILPYMGGFSNYAERCEEIARGGYPGFTLSAALVHEPSA
ncbi:MAG: NAD(P)/FAD-dependent oxidoreductase [Novosphingobium sp.]|nr:NAD(P)/FAD-dependent oxidoreductase [Novosphingobium sp.]